TDNFTGGNWPGVACTKIGVKKNGLDVWMWKYDGDLTTAPTMIIFNNGGGQQTKDLEFENGAVYNLAGKTNESVSTDINQTVAAQKAGAVKIYTLTGVKVAEVRNVQDAEYLLAPGAYICNGKKFVIK
ncbi:MAG: starch-binding protein, partial [Prevotella sp.]|nr:starch-binding protein [Prevotella sp.]